MDSILLPIWVVLSLFNLNPLGDLTYEDTHSAYVVLNIKEDSPIGGAVLNCDGGDVPPEYELACRSFPDSTIILFVRYWPPDPTWLGYITRHEYGHIQLGWDLVNDWHEPEAHALGCAAAPSFWECDQAAVTKGQAMINEGYR